MRASRLLSILILLQLRVRLTAQTLADEFEVSVRTIYRDIDELSVAGIPIYGDRGPGGGFQLLDGYRTKLTGLASDEAEAMFMIGMPGPAEALGLGAAARSAGRKLLASLPATSDKDANRISARFHLDTVDWYRTSDLVPYLPALARAVLDQRVVAMTYDSWTSVRDWLIEPLGLVLKAGAWYAAAQSGGVIRTFKVSNIRALQLQEATFERPADFDLPKWWSVSLSRFEAELRPATAIVRATALGLERIAKLGAYAATAAANAAPPDADGWARVTLPIETTGQAALMLLGIGPEVIVIDPTALRDQLRALVERLVILSSKETER
jgi:predicted DNA-binding transcriptional regulator YafY